MCNCVLYFDSIVVGVSRERVRKIVNPSHTGARDPIKGHKRGTHPLKVGNASGKVPRPTGQAGSE